MKLLAGLSLFVATAAVLSCAPVVETTSGRVVLETDGAQATWVEAAKESAVHDIPCTGPIVINALSSGISGNGFCYADGCGRRVTYGIQSRDRNMYRLVLVSSVDLNRAPE